MRQWDETFRLTFRPFSLKGEGAAQRRMRGANRPFIKPNASQ